MRQKSTEEVCIVDFDDDALDTIVNRKADGGITALHMAALNGHGDAVQLLLDLGARVSEVTVEDGTTIDLIGAGSTPLHYAACGGNAVCCQILIARGANLNAENSNGWTPLMVARSWHRNWLEGILSRQPEARILTPPSPYLSLPLMSIMGIAREYGWKSTDLSPAYIDHVLSAWNGDAPLQPRVLHEMRPLPVLHQQHLDHCAGPAGAIPCPLCRHAIVSFIALPGMTSPVRELPRTSLSLSLCTTCPAVSSDSDASIPAQYCRPDFQCTRIPPIGSSSFRPSVARGSLL
uniref:Uncharacterized protein n=1 Tax=Ananas comosus var. bracteatus TaxID=296719 RepID=A0A6V7PAG5_ANACO|nr:unnamed protein product [Ananas comosus var. bracteatus]